MPDSPIAAALQPFVNHGLLAGAVTLVATKDRILNFEAIGYSDIDKRKPMRTDATFWIASQTKPVTGTLLMMLVDEGKVNVEDPVEKYLPEFKSQMLLVTEDATHRLLRKPSHPITVREILTHTSGLGFRSPMEEPTLDLLPLAVAVRSHPQTPLLFEPGTKYAYSNQGINTAGRIVEVVSGLPFEEFMAQRLCRPLKMSDTTFVLNEDQAKRLAKTYTPNQAKTGLDETIISQCKYPLTDKNRYPFPAGGLFSTALDCGKFCQMILNGGTFEGKRYISEASLKAMTSRQTAPEIETSYGFGWSVNANEGSYGHGGALSSNMTINHKRGIVTVFLVQHAGYPGEGTNPHLAFKQAAEALVA
jgi:CubicO group peptidase (beta-lactamase class C family)